MTQQTNRSEQPLVVTDLGVTYGSGAEAHEVIRGLSLRVDPGEFVCIVGPSGAGKTTLLRCLSGLYRPSDGRVAVGDARSPSPSARSVSSSRTIAAR
ncbi:MAG: ATP-binding cassette domain-containing protein [Nocardioides sp.]